MPNAKSTFRSHTPQHPEVDRRRARRSLPTFSLTIPVVVRQPSSGNFLTRYVDQGSDWSTRREYAKQFFSIASAEAAARLLNGVVEPFDIPEPPKRDVSAREELLCVQVETGGGIFLGIQAGKRSIGLKALVLFEDSQAPKHQRSTMALTIDELSADRVRTEIRKKREEYGHAPVVRFRVSQQFAGVEV